MPLVKPNLQDEGDPQAAAQSAAAKSAVPSLAGEQPAGSLALAAPPAIARPALQRKPNLPRFPTPRLTDKDTQTRVPIIFGEATFRGVISVDGVINGQPGANSGLSVRLRGRSFLGADPEMNGEIRFRDMLRVNRHIAGSVYSQKGTLIVDTAALVDGNVEVSIAVINGRVNGDIVAHQRVELGPTAIIRGNIWTRALAIQNGAIFEGVCQMLEGKYDDD